MGRTTSLYDWIGGIAALERLTTEFYRRVAGGICGPFLRIWTRVIRPCRRVYRQVFGGPPLYSSQHGGHPEMVRHHLNRHLTEEQRRRWINLMLDTYTDLGPLPADPEFASALTTSVGHPNCGDQLAAGCRSADRCADAQVGPGRSQGSLYPQGRLVLVGALLVVRQHFDDAALGRRCRGGRIASMPASSPRRRVSCVDALHPLRPDAAPTRASTRAQGASLAAGECESIDSSESIGKPMSRAWAMKRRRSSPGGP